MTSTADSGEETVVYDLDPACTLEDVSEGNYYHATVNGVVDYGVFVDLSESVSGLAHESNYEGSYEVGDDLVVELTEIRENGDLSFDPVDLDDWETVAVGHDYDIADAGELGDAIGETVHLEGEVVQIKQTGGPTIFHVSDETGVIPCAAFEEAGVRAYPEVEIDDVIRVTGTVDERDNALQVEVENLDVLTDDEAEDVRERLESALEERARPHETEPLVEWPALTQMFPDLEEVATQLRRTVLESRPIRVRHHADGDGMCASIPVQYALERFIRRPTKTPRPSATCSSVSPRRPPSTRWRK